MSKATRKSWAVHATATSPPAPLHAERGAQQQQARCRSRLRRGGVVGHVSGVTYNSPLQTGEGPGVRLLLRPRARTLPCGLRYNRQARHRLAQGCEAESGAVPYLSVQLLFLAPLPTLLPIAIGICVE